MNHIEAFASRILLGMMGGLEALEQFAKAGGITSRQDHLYLSQLSVRIKILCQRLQNNAEGKPTDQPRQPPHLFTP
jgi:hypothetical protein